MTTENQLRTRRLPQPAVVSVEVGDDGVTYDLLWCGHRLKQQDARPKRRRCRECGGNEKLRAAYHLRRFMSKVERTEDHCWTWRGHIFSNGYGGFIADGRQSLAHRLSYEHFVGPIPDGLVLDHLCRNRACVRPDHLQPVAMRENLLRGSGPSALRAAQTHCIRGHEFIPENTYRRRRGGRDCRICMRERDRRRHRDAGAA
jgi:hypothetical protein